LHRLNKYVTSPVAVFVHSQNVVGCGEKIIRGYLICPRVGDHQCQVRCLGLMWPSALIWWSYD